jgi:general secretion pathway protein A
MYKDFYGLKENAFSTTPDPKFLYPSPGHREALAQVLYGVHQNKGFIVLTGEVGTGKTTLVHALRRRLDDSTAVAFLFNSTLPFDGILEYMLEEFGVAKTGTTPAQRLFALNNFLIERRRVGQNTVLILDEAQNLDVRTLEQVRLLSNFESTSEKLLQILLVGQPELRGKLALPELRQLRQRIALSSSIRPLTAHETHECIRTRLRIAGASDLGLFTDRALARIAEYTGGIPRLVNILCDHCLVIGYAERERRIGPPIVEQAIKLLQEVGLPRQKTWAIAPKSRMTPLRWAITALAGLLLGSAVSLAFRPEAARVLDLARSWSQVVR